MLKPDTESPLCIHMSTISYIVILDEAVHYTDYTIGFHLDCNFLQSGWWSSMDFDVHQQQSD